MKADDLAAVAKAKAERRAVVHWTRLETDEQGLAYEAGQAPADLREAVEARLRSGKSGTVDANGGESFLNVHLPEPRLVLIGAVHISQALAPMARAAGFDVLVVDPRTAFATPERFEGTALIADWPAEVEDQIALDRHTALAALTHDPKIDDHPLGMALETGCFYVGALGSRKTHGARRERLAEMGISEASLARIHAPIGLDIGAASPAEIAVAVLAEVIGAMRQS